MSTQQRERVDAMMRAGPQPSATPTIQQRRDGFAALMATMAVPAGVATTATTLGERPALLVEPVAPARPGTLLYFHGGSYALGSPATAISLTANLVVRTGARSISLDYRLAPEHPFPAAVQDCAAAYRALLDDGVEASSIALAGDSAGGGLAVTTCLLARAEGLPAPAAVLTFSAGLDATRSGASMTTKAGIDPFFTRQGLEETSAMYTAGQDLHQELLSPAVAADMTGFPPLMLQVGGNEVLLDDSTRLADRARDAGVDVVLDVTANVPHVFQAFAGGGLDEADRALERAALFLAQHLNHA